VGCAYCINDSLPKRHKNITPSQIRKACCEIASTGEFDTVNITGGEPFEVFELLLEATGIIASYGLAATVVTSASWAASAQVAQDMLVPLAQQGLKALIISRDEFHEHRVPHDYVAHALRRALQLGLIAALNLTIGTRIKGRDELLQPIASRLASEEFARIQVLETELLRAGRASRLKPDKFDEKQGEKPHPLICNVCGPILLESGEFTACCAIELPGTSPLRLGHCDTTDAGEMVHSLRTDPLVLMIRCLGLQRMAELLGPEWIDLGLAAFIHSAQPADLCRVCVRLLADPNRVARLRQLARDPAIRREMAVRATLFYGDDPLSCGDMK
jgi:hypothetical protein